MTNEWFDPGANKKKGDVRPADVPASRATGPAVKLPKHPQFNKDGGQSTTVNSSPPPSASSKADTQRTLAIRELDHILSGAHEEVAEPAPIESGVDSALPSTNLKEATLRAVRSQVATAQKTVEELNLAAEEKKRAADTTKSCYFAAHAQALEVAIATEKTSNREPTSPEEGSEKLLRMEYEYRTAGATANRANADATIAAKTLETLTRRLANITPKPKLCPRYGPTRGYTTSRDAYGACRKK
uniref:Uncharacterized protein n=1 Tax=Peronospora matthiolae TaxID=2874970 RepID=A0AAV1TF61_9STRA